VVGWRIPKMNDSSTSVVRNDSFLIGSRQPRRRAWDVTGAMYAYEYHSSEFQRWSDGTWSSVQPLPEELDGGAVAVDASNLEVAVRNDVALRTQQRKPKQ
jgi:hypothetical protein